MGRLIDADLLLARVVEANPMGGMIGGKFVEDLIKSEPSAYDVDAVIEWLEDDRQQALCMSDKDDYFLGQLNVLNRVIPLVKGAVKDE